MSWLDPLAAAAFIAFGAPISWIELIAVVLSLCTVWLNIRINAWAWPLAILSSLLYFELFWKHKLYGDAGLQVFFALIAGWGWWQWLRGTVTAGEPLMVRNLDQRGRLMCLVLLACGWPATGLFLDHYTDTDVPWWDAFPTAASVLGQWLLGRKYVDNWPVWIAVNIVSVGLFAWKGLWLTAMLYMAFIAMAAFGWCEWARLRSHRQAAN